MAPHVLKRGFQEGTDLRGRGLIIGLPKLRTREEERRSLPSLFTIGIVSSDDRVAACNVWLQPRDTVATLLALLTQAHIRAGLQPLGDPAWDKGGEKCREAQRRKYP